MAAITLPYTTESSTYGSTFSSTYSWSATYYTTASNTSKITSSAYMKINSFVPKGNTVDVNITIYSKNAITRTGTNGYTCSTFTYKTLPTIKITNVNLGESITLYNMALTTTVADNGAGTAVSGSITHSATTTISVSRKWFLSTNSVWNFSISDAITIVDTSATHTNTKTFPNFNVAPLFRMAAKINGELCMVNDITVKYNGQLYPAEQLIMKVGDNLVQ